MSTFTIRITTKDKESSKWLWESLKGQEINGITVNAMSDGDLFKRYRCVESQLELYEANSFYALEDDEQDEFDKLEVEKQATWNRD